MPGYRCPPVPPPAITTVSGVIRIRTHTATSVPLDHRASTEAAAVADACCEMFNSTPIAIRFIISDDPPALMSGSGMPLVGASPVTTLMLTNACRRDHHREPDAEQRAEAIRREQRDAQPAPGDDAERDQHRGRADESDLLADDGEDEIVVGLGQEEQLLNAVARVRGRTQPPEPIAIFDCVSW